MFNISIIRLMSLDLTDDKSTLVQVMAWCRQATSHYLSQWWPKSLSPYGVTRLIDYVGGYLYLKESENRNFKFEVDAHQLDLRLHHFTISFQFKKNQKLACLWLAGEVVNYVGIYGSKATEGFSAFQAWSCLYHKSSYFCPQKVYYLCMMIFFDHRCFQ